MAEKPIRGKGREGGGKGGEKKGGEDVLAIHRFREE